MPSDQEQGTDWLKPSAVWTMSGFTERMATQVTGRCGRIGGRASGFRFCAAVFSSRCARRCRNIIQIKMIPATPNARKCAAISINVSESVGLTP